MERWMRRARHSLNTPQTFFSASHASCCHVSHRPGRKTIRPLCRTPLGRAAFFGIGFAELRKPAAFGPFAPLRISVLLQAGPPRFFQS